MSDASAPSPVPDPAPASASSSASASAPTGPAAPIALIGAACRLPGADDVPAFWELLRAGRDTVTEIPPERFGATHWHDPADPDHGGRGLFASRAGGFLERIDEFDAAFFSISPHEATRIDPQHRLLLEITWEALEDAGIPAEQLAGTDTAVFTGCLSSDYWDLLRDCGNFDLHAAIGSGTWGMPAGRISHQLDLRGPSMGVEAACATSLLAVHLACDALRTGQSGLAIVANVNLLLSPDFYLSLSEAQILSPRGRSRFGDADADGYVRSEGAVALILKPLQQAVADGDRIYATILGSAVSNNGSSAGTLMASGLEGQQAALRRAYAAAGVHPGDIDYVEAHGPGTPLGDATEVAALSEVLSEGRDAGRPCLVGSSKSNIGHTEVAAGAVGLLKTALAMQHRIIPATLHVDRPRPELQLPGAALRLALGEQGWPGSKPALAGVSSFGLSGVNTHLVLQEAPAAAPLPRPDRQAPSYLLPLSARDPIALQVCAERYADALGGGAELVDVAYSAGARRSHHPFRLAVIGSGSDEIAGRLRAFSAGERSEGMVGGDQRSLRAPRVVFVFSGHGGQWVGMGRSLLGDNTFAARLSECSRAIEAELGWSLLQRLQQPEPLTRVDEVQPAVWAMQVALAGLWQHWGIRPDLVIGHSMGEVAAAVVAGVLSLTDGAAVICRRSRLIREHARPGAMWAVQLGADAAREAIAAFADRVSIAVVNSDHACVLSGDDAALAQICAELTRRDVYCRQLQVDYASHAPQVDDVRAPLLAALSDLRPQNGAVPMHSTVTSRRTAGTGMDGAYWMANLRQPVRFGEAVQAVLADPQPTLFIEVNSHPALLSAIEDAAAALGQDVPAIPSLLRHRPELEVLLTGLAQAYVLGCVPDWAAVNPGGRYVPLPGYAWNRQSYWVSPAPGRRPNSGSANSGSANSGSANSGSANSGVATSAAPKPAPRRRIAVCSAAAMTEHLISRVTEALGMHPADLDPDVPLTHAGLDSLLASRIGEQLRHDLGLKVPVRELLGTLALADLASALFHRARLVADQG